jgi:hypothetical protein
MSETNKISGQHHKIIIKGHFFKGQQAETIIVEKLMLVDRLAPETLFCRTAAVACGCWRVAIQTTVCFQWFSSQTVHCKG